MAKNGIEKKLGFEEYGEYQVKLWTPYPDGLTKIVDGKHYRVKELIE